MRAVKLLSRSESYLRALKLHIVTTGKGRLCKKNKHNSFKVLKSNGGDITFFSFKSVYLKFFYLSEVTIIVMSFSVTDCSLVIVFTHFLIINVIVIKSVSIHIHNVIDADIAIIIALISSSLSSAQTSISLLLSLMLSSQLLLSSLSS